MAQTIYHQDEISKIISEIPEEFHVPAIVLDSGTTFYQNEIKKFTLHCNPVTLEKLSDLISKFKIVYHHQELANYKRYIPLEMSNQNLFRIVGHLLAPGLCMDKRSSVIIALLIHQTGLRTRESYNIILSERAKIFLHDQIGTWLDFDFPCNFFVGFIKFIICFPEFLTSIEKRKLGIMKFSYSVFLNRKRPIYFDVVKLVDGSHVPDYKYRCSTCNLYYSFGLIAKKKPITCVFCEHKCDENYYHFDRSKTDSYYHQCKICQVIYPTARKLISSGKKCFQCRTGTNINKIMCRSCNNQYVDPAGLFDADFFYCHQCNKSVSPVKNISAPFESIYRENKSLFDNYFKLDLDLVLTGKIYANRHQIFNFQAYNQNNRPTFKFGKFKLCEQNYLLEVIHRQINRKDFDVGVCSINFHQTRVSDLQPVCRRPDCSALACRACMSGWFSSYTSTRVFDPNVMYCPFCERKFSKNILRTYGKYNLLRVTTQLDNNWWYASCFRCFHPIKYLSKLEHPKIPGEYRGICDKCNKRDERLGIINPNLITGSTGNKGPEGPIGISCDSKKQLRYKLVPSVTKDPKGFRHPMEDQSLSLVIMKDN